MFRSSFTRVSALLCARRFFQPCGRLGCTCTGGAENAHWWRWRFFSVLLFVSNYLNYLALYLCIAPDYLIWNRRERPLKPADWAVSAGAANCACEAICSVWNPLGDAVRKSYDRNIIRLGREFHVFFLWQWRNLDRCEFIRGRFFLRPSALPWRAATNGWHAALWLWCCMWLL